VSYLRIIVHHGGSCKLSGDIRAYDQYGITWVYTFLSTSRLYTAWTVRADGGEDA